METVNNKGEADNILDNILEYCPSGFLVSARIDNVWMHDGELAPAFVTKYHHMERLEFMKNFAILQEVAQREQEKMGSDSEYIVYPKN